jgi:hypothetical protein
MRREDDDVRLLLVDLDDLVFEVAPDKRGGFFTGFMSTWEIGEEGVHADIDDESALHLGGDGALHGRPLHKGLVDILPELYASTRCIDSVSRPSFMSEPTTMTSTRRRADSRLSRPVRELAQGPCPRI